MDNERKRKRQEGDDFLLCEESVMRVTFADKLKDENYFMAKSRIRVRLKPADAEWPPAVVERKELRQNE